MKRRLTLAIGCLACAMPSIASVTSPQTARTAQVAAHDLQQLQQPPLSLPSAAHAAQQELEQRGLAERHAIASIIFLKGSEPATGHYDVRIEPPATLADGARLRGFCVTLNGAIQPSTDFRTGTGATLSTQTMTATLPERSLRSDEREG